MTQAPASLPPVVVDDLGDGILQVRLNRPDRLNAMGVDMVKQLQQAIDRAIAKPARVILIRGTGRAFCSGADLKERKDMDESARLEHNRGINAAINALSAAPMPTIAVINGLALGGGCEMALACDLRIGADDVSIGLTEARIGAIPGAGGTQRLPRLIGVSRALELMLLGEPITGRRAEQIGLLNQAVPAEHLDEAVLHMARLLASRSPSGAAAMKRVVYGGIETTLSEGLKIEHAGMREILRSADYAEGLAAFAAKRPPKFPGK